jgi:hypothetical protein
MLSHLKKRLGVLTAIAVLAALVPALAASPASAAPATVAVAPGNGATYSACPTGSAAAAGFTDTTSTDVDCIKMHGITTGVTATTYEPASNIPRWQMALYLTRFATAAGTTLGSGADQGFTDISGYSAAIQTAINQIKQLGVTVGTTATTYSPDDNVTREQMAMFVERMLGKTIAGVGGHDATATYSGLIGTTSTLTYNYTDIDAGSVTYEGHNAIAEIYHLGIPGDLKTATAFSPAADITRADMATWMTNALGHTNARPAGVWVQVSAASPFGSQAATLHITHRDANRAAVPGTLIDVFSDVTAALTDPFSATTGLCTTSNTAELGNAGTECSIDLGDVSTDVNGNVGGTTGQSGGTVAAATTVTYWAHTGAVGTAFNNLTMTANTVARSQSTAASIMVLTNTIPTYNVMDSSDVTFELVPYGTSVTITGTLRTTATGTVVPLASVVSVVDSVWNMVDDGAGIDNNGAAGTLLSTTTTAGVTGADGVWTHTITQADPSALATNLNRTHTTSVITWDLNADGVAEQAAGTVSIAWDDNASLGNTTTMTEGSYYGVGLALAAGGVSRTNTAKVHDQYGNGLANQVVTFTSASTTGSTDVTEAFTQSSTRTTDTTGTATLSYTDLQTATAQIVTTASPAVGTDATSTYYRVDGTTPAFTEVDTTVDDGATVGTNFTGVATSDLVVFSADHNLATGDEVIITTAPNADGTVLTDNSEWYVVLDTTTPARKVTFHTTRTVSALGVVSYGTAANIAADAGGTSAGVAEVNNGWVHGSDRVMQIMIHDNANDKLVVRSQIAADNWDYHAYTYDSGDQFNVYADGQGSNSLTPASMATFETHVAAKMNATTGAPNAGFADDIVSIVYNNAAVGGGVSTFNLGS